MVEEARLASQREIRAYARARGVQRSLLVWRDKREEGRCRMCLRPAAVRPLTRHHVVPRAWLSRSRPRLYVLRNVAANIVPLCRPCHDAVEADPAARRLLRKVLAPDEVAFALAVAGSWFRRHYPDAAAPAAAARPRRAEAPHHKRNCHPVYGCVYGCVYAPKA